MTYRASSSISKAELTRFIDSPASGFGMRLVRKFTTSYAHKFTRKS
jgi:hypothetical protein